jgi:hypothetical protein
VEILINEHRQEKKGFKNSKISWSWIISG